MSYPRFIREAARRLWLLGLSDEKVIIQLQTDFPDEKTPTNDQTVMAWRKKENWDADLEIIVSKADQKRTEMLADELASANSKTLASLNGLDAHLNLLLKRLVRDELHRIVDTQLTPGDLAQIASAFERTVRTSRLIRDQTTAHIKTETVYNLNHSLMTDEEVDRMANGEKIEAVCSKERIQELKVD